VNTLLVFAHGLHDNGEVAEAERVLTEVGTIANAVPVIKEAVINALRRRYSST
jgi:hypothetical protein